MLKQIDIWGFKAIKASGPIDFGPLTLFIGRNGSGKSSIIEALQWLQESVASGLREATSHRFVSFPDLLNWRAAEVSLRLHHGEGAQESSYELSVKKGKFGPLVRREACREGRTSGAIWTISSRKGPKGPAVRSIKGGNPVRDSDALALYFVTGTKAPGAERLLKFLQDAVFLRLSPTAMAPPGRLHVSTRGPLLDEDGRGLVSLLNRLTKVQRARVTRQIGEIILGVEDVDVVAQGDADGYYRTIERMKAKGGSRLYPVASWMLSEGTRRLTAIFALLAVRPRPSLIAIEEIENGLDPWTLTYVLSALREASEEGVQIVLTTHSPFLLDHVAPDEVIHVRRERGHTTYEPITSFEEVARNRGLVAPGAMYIAGYMRDAEPK